MLGQDVSDLDEFDDLAVDFVQLGRESTGFSEDAAFAVASLWCRADVPVHAFDVITIATVHAWCHTRD